MRRVLVATDFSTRSDRAIRRGVLLARTLDADLILIHVVDGDQPRSLVKSVRAAAGAMLEKQARSLRELDGIRCDRAILSGEPFDGIAKAAVEFAPDLLVIGAHRRRALKDIFVGTTAERAIRLSRCPIVMANAVPAEAYRHVLIAVDLSECAADAIRAVIALDLIGRPTFSVVHVFDAPGTGPIVRASMTEDRVQDYIAGMEARAAADLSAYLAGLDFKPVSRLLRPNRSSAAEVICSVAREISADLVVVGTRGRAGVKKAVLGSVAEEVLRISDRDVLAVPPKANAKGRRSKAT